MASRKLVLLCTSQRPDPYFNAICYAKRELGIDEFELVAVGDETGPELADKASAIADSLGTLVQHLAAGEYWSRNPASDAVTTAPLSNPDAFSKTLEQLGWGAIHLSHRGVTESALIPVIRQGAQTSSVFDVSGCKKGVLAGATAWIVAHGGSSIRSFELQKPPSYGQEDLYPVLLPGDYEYRDISESPLLSSAIQRVNRFMLNKRTFLAVAIAIAVIIAILTTFFSDTVALGLLTGLSSFASIVSAVTLLYRD